MTAHRIRDLAGHFEKNQFQPNAREFGQMVELVTSRLPSYVDLYLSIWEVHLVHEADQRRGDRSVELVVELDEETVRVALVLERRPLQLRKQWAGSIKEASSIIVDWTTEMLVLREKRGQRVSFEMDL
ncbi:MAG: hypothetical protein Q8L14_16130 [Myxococcales bacterium]|nr:hypothetical protein [Myxococcales bacterium]